ILGAAQMLSRLRAAPGFAVAIATGSFAAPAAMLPGLCTWSRQKERRAGRARIATGSPAGVGEKPGGKSLSIPPRINWQRHGAGDAVFLPRSACAFFDLGRFRENLATGSRPH
ncbi:MAG: hypothetical protein ACREQR_12905, partial [Candidatus Binataceae bacterium]